MSTPKDGISVVVAIDFGTMSSGYACASKTSPDDTTNITVGKGPGGPGGTAGCKIPTIIKYQNESYSTVKSWGFSALPENPKKYKPGQPRSIELFKLFLFKNLMETPFLPDKLGYKKAITDYLKQLGELIKEEIRSHAWKISNFYSQVLIVLTIPVGFDDGAIAVMRDCAFNAELIKEKDSRYLIFVTEPEAAAIHLLNSSEEVHYSKPGDSIMVVDCGGGTVNLTSREVLTNNRMSETTESTSGNCGSRFVDKEFIKFLCYKLGGPTIEFLEKDHYDLLQYMVQEFCRYVKFRFTGDKSEFKSYKIDLKKYPLIKNIIEGTNQHRSLKEANWLISVEFTDVRAMFDPPVKKIISLIKEQLRQQNKTCSTIMLVGGFSESKYLQARIREEFRKVEPDINIYVPTQPMITTVMGGVRYGLQKVLQIESGIDRISKRTYGTDILRRTKPDDPPSKRLPNGKTALVFKALARRGKQISVNDKVVEMFRPHSVTQSSIDFDLYVTEAFDAKFCDDPGVSLLCSWEIILPSNFSDITIEFTLTFGTEILATAEIHDGGKKYPVKPKVKYEQ